MKALEQFEVWLVAGSQEMYGTEILRRVDEHAREIAASLEMACFVNRSWRASPLGTRLGLDLAL
jgi:L-arabinose isomerase